jgi:hypothetical protein
MSKFELCTDIETWRSRPFVEAMLIDPLMFAPHKERDSTGVDMFELPEGRYTRLYKL